MLATCERDVVSDRVSGVGSGGVTHQLCALGGESMIVLCISMRTSPTAATFLSLWGILGTCGTMKLTRICDHSLEVKEE